MTKQLDTTLSLFVSTPKEYVASLPRYQFAGRIVVVDTDEHIIRACSKLSHENVLGFDTETRPTFHKGGMRRPALIQLSTHKVCYLFRICQTGIPQPLTDLLCNPHIVKVGVSLGDDIRALHRTKAIKPKGWVDLQHIAKDLRLEDMGLARLFANVFGQRIAKTQQRSNWEAATLSASQMKYAATDAEACLKLYEVLYPLTQTHNYTLHPFLESDFSQDSSSELTLST